VANKFEENLHADFGGWPVTHLDWPLLPGFQVIWAKPSKWQPPGDQARWVMSEQATQEVSLPFSLPIYPMNYPT
jgi:hypothetical protein